jgi:outer membrane protein
VNRFLSVFLVLAGTSAIGQTAQRLTLAQAEALALQNHPRIAAASRLADAEREAVRQTSAARYPLLAGNFTATAADRGTQLGAGQINASSLVTRSAVGLNLNQVLFDFGRVRALTASAESRASAQAQAADATRADILLRVRESYFRSLLAQSQLRVLRQTVEARRLTFRQVSALAQSSLRSTLDVSFAELNLGEAELGLEHAENEARSSELALVAALGYSDGRRFELLDEPDPAPLEDDAEALVAVALARRPDLAALRLRAQSARSFALSERRQAFPIFTAIGVGGYYGPRDDRLQPSYASAGLNINVPLFNGGLFASRRREAELRAEASDHEMRDLEIQIARDVRAAWVEADNARRRLDLTARVLEQATRTLKLAQTRYDLGLSSIIELSQAQLSATGGEVAVAAARYDYQLKRSLLEYQTGRR